MHAPRVDLAWGFSASFQNLYRGRFGFLDLADTWQAMSGTGLVRYRCIGRSYRSIWAFFCDAGRTAFGTSHSGEREMDTAVRYEMSLKFRCSLGGTCPMLHFLCTLHLGVMIERSQACWYSSCAKGWMRHLVILGASSYELYAGIGPTGSHCTLTGPSG